MPTTMAAEIFSRLAIVRGRNGLPKALSQMLLSEFLNCNDSLEGKFEALEAAFSMGTVSEEECTNLGRQLLLRKYSHASDKL